MSTKNRLFTALPLENLLKSAQGALFSHFDIVNVTLNCWFTQVKHYSCFFAHVCVPPRGHSGPGVHTRAH